MSAIEKIEKELTRIQTQPRDLEQCQGCGKEMAAQYDPMCCECRYPETHIIPNIQVDAIREKDCVEFFSRRDMGFIYEQWMQNGMREIEE